MSGIFDFDPDQFLDPNAAPAPVPDRMPEAWEMGLERLKARPVPSMAEKWRWEQIVADALRIGDRYRDQILAAGWNTENLFGFDLDEPTNSLSLAVVMRGNHLVSINSVEAWLRTAKGYFSHRPNMVAGCPMLWDFKEPAPARTRARPSRR